MSEGASTRNTWTNVRPDFPVAELNGALDGCFGAGLAVATLNETTLTVNASDNTDNLLVEQMVQEHISTSPAVMAERADARVALQELRALRQMGRNAFMALSQADRDRALYDALVNVTRVLITLGRG